MSGEVTDVCSFYSLPSTILGNDKYNMLKASASVLCALLGKYSKSWSWSGWLLSTLQDIVPALSSPHHEEAEAAYSYWNVATSVELHDLMFDAERAEVESPQSKGPFTATELRNLLSQRRASQVRSADGAQVQCSHPCQGSGGG